MKKWVTFFVTIGGITEVVIGLIHFIWPFNLLTQNEFVTLSPRLKDILLLMSFVIGLCLLIFGGLTIHFVKRLRYLETTTIIFCLSQGVLWIGRLILEIMYPVRIPFFSLQNVSVYILICCFLISAMYLSVLSLLIYDKNH